MRFGRIKTALVTALAACNAPAHDEAAAPAPVRRARVERTIAHDVVAGDRLVRPVLYTWTTREQIEELRATRRLLSREESPERGASYFEQVVRELAERGDPIAQLLDTTTYAKLRFAWHAPWATRLGWPGEHYGDQLVRVRLASDALVLTLSSASGTFDVRDLDGVQLPFPYALAHPERIGAVYFVTPTYREVVLCNEAAIAEWSAGTDDIADELAAEATMLEALARTPDAASQRSYAAALAFDSPSYRFDADHLRALAQLLRTTPRSLALEGGRRAPFPGVGARRGKPRVVPAKQRGTYGTF